MQCLPPAILTCVAGESACTVARRRHGREIPQLPMDEVFVALHDHDDVGSGLNSRNRRRGNRARVPAASPCGLHPVCDQFMAKTGVSVMSTMGEVFRGRNFEIRRM